MSLKKNIKFILIKLGLYKPKLISPPFFTKDYFKNSSYVIGDYSYGKPNIRFPHPDSNLRIGKFCSISSGVNIFLGGNHRVDWVTTYPFNDISFFSEHCNNLKGHPSTKGDVNIGNDVWIGFGATIMSGVTIGNGSVIAANSLLTKDVGPYQIWGGNPARLIKKRFTDREIEYLNKMAWWDWDIDKVIALSPKLCSENLNHFIEKNNE